jgi:hypothetical protein
MSHEAERTAVEQLFHKVTLPIIVQDKGRFGIVGTATLFTIQDRPFLVTGGHTILDYSVDRWAYSEHPTGGPICTLGALHHHRPKNERYDVATKTACARAASSHSFAHATGMPGAATPRGPP